MVAFVLANGLGLFGRGLFSERTLANPDRSIEIHYEPVVRVGAPTDVIPDTRLPLGCDRVAVTMAKDLADHLGLESITPRPATWEAGGDGMRMVSPVLAGQEQVVVELAGSPNVRGCVHPLARIDAGETISWSQDGEPEQAMTDAVIREPVSASGILEACAANDMPRLRCAEPPRRTERARLQFDSLLSY